MTAIDHDEGWFQMYICLLICDHQKCMYISQVVQQKKDKPSEITAVSAHYQLFILPIITDFCIINFSGDV